MRFSTVASIFTVVFFCIGSGNAANILCLFPSPSKSHMIIDMAIARILVDRGHNVTVVTTMPLKDRNPKYTHIFLPPSAEDYAEYHKYLSTAATRTNMWSSFYDMFWANVERVRIQDKAFSSPRFKELLDNPGNHFDVVVIGWVFNTYQFGVGAHFNCPIIVTFINNPTNQVLAFAGSPASLSSVPTIYSLDMLRFSSRLRNMVFNFFWTAMEEFSEYKMAQYYEEHFSAERYPSYEDIKRNVSLVLCASHFSDGRIRPLTPGFIEIGGIQIKDKADPLPKGISEFLETGDDGFILFSLGTNVKNTDISSNATLAMFKVLSESKYKILWKWDIIDPPGQSANIMFGKWFPQDDLLAHPKLKLFITHAGKGSAVEAQYHGVPMLSIPVIGDQFGNARDVAVKGFGITIDHFNVTEQSFRKDFYEILENRKYLAAVTKFSKMYRDRPLSPKESVIYWTEYVIRHGGAKHMQSPVIHMNFFQRNSIDVFAVLGIGVYLSFVVVRCFIRFCYMLAFRNKLKSE